MKISDYQRKETTTKNKIGTSITLTKNNWLWTKENKLNLSKLINKVLDDMRNKDEN